MDSRSTRVEKLSEDQSDSTNNPYQGQRNSFLMSLLVLSAAVIKADGKTTAQELATLRNFFVRNFGAQAGKEAEDIVKRLLSQDFNLYHYLVSLAACDEFHRREVQGNLSGIQGHLQGERDVKF